MHACQHSYSPQITLRTLPFHEKFGSRISPQASADKCLLCSTFLPQLRNVYSRVHDPQPLLCWQTFVVSTHSDRLVSQRRVLINHVSN